MIDARLTACPTVSPAACFSWRTRRATCPTARLSAFLSSPSPTPPPNPATPSSHKHQALKTPTAVNKHRCVAWQSETGKEELVSMCITQGSLTNGLVAAGSELTIEPLQAKCKCRAMEVSPKGTQGWRTTSQSETPALQGFSDAKTNTNWPSQRFLHVDVRRMTKRQLFSTSNMALK